MKKLIVSFIKNNKVLYNMGWLIKNKKLSAKTDLVKNISGTGNKTEISAITKFENCLIDIHGNNNVIKIASKSSFKNVTFYIVGDNNTIEIGNEVTFNRGGEFWIEDHHCVIKMGDRNSLESVHLAATEPHSKITIGNDCLFAYDIDVRSGDSHSILDATTGERINYAKDVNIADRVWVASHCSILKGVSIANDCVIATRSVITKSLLTSGVIAGGVPAKVIKENIIWSAQRIYK